MINEKDGNMKILINEHGIDEAEKIGYIIQDLVNNKKCQYKDIAILYRMNLQSFPFLLIYYIYFLCIHFDL